MSKAKEVDRAQELRKNIDTMDACVAAGKSWPFVISTVAIRHVLDELDAARAALSASSEQQAAQQDERNDALQDSAYAAGMLTGWNLCVADDHATFSRIRGDRMTGAARMAIAARASNGGKA